MAEKLGKAIVKIHKLILVIAVALLIPSVLGYIHTKVNYDLLTYLPDDIETMVGQDILKEEMGSGGFSTLICEGMKEKDVAELKEKIMKVDGVKNVIWYDSVLDISVPMDVLPDNIRDAFNADNSTMMFIIFSDTTSADRTIQAVRDIRSLCNQQCFLTGMSAILVDTQDLSESEAPIYVIMAVALSVLVLMLSMDSWLAPFLFLASIGMAILYNLGSNLFLGSISYLTKALAAVLQLGVTMDYSIFLWHSYESELETGKPRDEAMAAAIGETFTSIVGSSITTVAGFVALCFMSFKLGLDIGVVMAKGVVFGVISCITILPSLILAFEKPLQKSKHKAVLPDFKGIGSFVTRHCYKFLIIALIMLIPVIHGYRRVPVYFNLDSSLPDTLPSVIANAKQENEYHMNATHILIMDAAVENKEVRSMADEMKQEPGVKFVLGLNTIIGPTIPQEMIPDKLKGSLITDRYQILLIGSEYKVASDEVNEQINQLSAIAKNYDSTSFLIGEAPCTKDLIEISNHDFGAVSTASIGIIFIIIAFVFKSITLPVILVAVIEFGIMLNMGIPYYTGTKLPFIANIVIGTIQLGATVDYAILMTTRFRRNRTAGMEKRSAIKDAVENSAKSIVVSALSFFAATFGVGLYSNIDMISSLCVLMSRGALISMICVIFLLPSLLLIFDTVISKTTMPQKG
ncbi:MAG: MMPL family transporter [Solobacterium sp.]|nr:MMPL family transporter [Solobacterium sp.]